MRFVASKTTQIMLSTISRNGPLGNQTINQSITTHFQRKTTRQIVEINGCRSQESKRGEDDLLAIHNTWSWFIWNSGISDHPILLVFPLSIFSIHMHWFAIMYICYLSFELQSGSFYLKFLSNVKWADDDEACVTRWSAWKDFHRILQMDTVQMFDVSA